jgi:hypothetical protein
MRRRGLTFFSLGIVFIAVGASGRSFFLGLGAAFLAAGVYFLVRSRREAGR